MIIVNINYFAEKVTFSPPSTSTHIEHEKFQPIGGPGTIGYAQIGEWRDTILVPPLSNITVRRNYSF